MTDTTDTSAQAVERLAKQHDEMSRNHGGEDAHDVTSRLWHQRTAATLRTLFEQVAALEAERDAAEADLKTWKAGCVKAEDDARKMRGALIRAWQRRNDCNQTGAPCHLNRRCTCALEAEDDAAIAALRKPVATAAMVEAGLATPMLTFRDWPGRLAEIRSENTRRVIQAALDTMTPAAPTDAAAACRPCRPNSQEGSSDE